MFEFSRLGLEVTENTNLVGSQISPVVAGFASGGFVTVWTTTDTAQDGNGRAIKMQLIGPNGAKVGSEILVNSAATGDQTLPTVAVLSNGTFVVGWQTSDTTQDGSGSAIKAQIFDGSGVAIGSEFRVNSQLVSNQTAPAITALTGGGFAVAWQTADTAQDGVFSAIKAQIYSASGAATGGEFLVNQAMFGAETLPSVSGLSSGGFVSTWTVGSGTNADIYAQIVDAAGTKIGSQFLVNTVTAFNQDMASVSQISGGRFVVTWMSSSSTTTGDTQIKAQIFSNVGTKIGGEFQVNTTKVDSNGGFPVGSSAPQVDDLPGGGFIISWTASGGTTINSNIRAQIYDANGVPASGEITLNTVSDRLESTSDIAVDGNGSILSVWSSSIGVDADIRGELLTTHAGPVIGSSGGGETAAIVAPENQTAVVTVSATNPNGAGALTYSIIGGLDAAKFAINSATGELKFKTAPNFEVKADFGANGVYDVVVAASDGTYVDVQAIAVTIGNVAETPVFNAVSGSYAVAEINTSGAVATFGATDGDNDVLTYSLSGADAARFTINTTSGAVSYAALLDYEAPADADANNFYQFSVVASDGVFTITKAVTVEILSWNEGPTIVSNGGGATASLTLAENTGLATSVVVTDPENNTNFTYSIIGGADAARFIIAANGQLFFRATPNFEAPTDGNLDNVYEVIVQVTDGFYPDTQTLSITIANVNEAPVITSNGGGNAAAVSVAENGVAVATVTSTDPDGSARTYAIAGGADAAKFVIDATTGALAFAAAPNFEAPGDANGDNIYQVNVSASDSSLSDTQTINVTVTNVNEAPTITSASALSVVENGTAAGVVTSTDSEGTPRSYAIVGGADAAGFTIDAATGALSFVAVPDNEAPGDADGDNVYQVSVRASDGALSDTRDLSITVTNLDEAPIITSNGGGDAATIGVAENTTAAAVVAASDPESNTRTFAIAGGADAAKFAIDAATGALTFVTAPDFDAPGDANADNAYEVVVSASDGALLDTQALTLVVSNVNEGPAFVSGAGFVTSENVLAAGVVHAADPDGNSLSYAIAGGTDAASFAIDAATGALSFIAAPNFEAPGDADADNVYQVSVSASDGAISTSQAVTITVANADEAPVISSQTVFTVLENETAAGAIMASDPENAMVTFAIGGGDDEDGFIIDAATGALSFLAAPNFESAGDANGDNLYEVIVVASDGILTSSQAITVAVSNVNEAPTITSASTFSFAENGTAVATVTSVDPEATARTYTIAGGDDGAKFAIDASTGALTFVAAPNFEDPSDANGDNVYQVIVSASDGSLSDNQSLAITVTNVNEGPTITSASAFSVAENGTSVATVASTDPEATARSYVIAGGVDAAKFVINASTGTLSFIAAPNFEAPTDADGDNVYQVVVSASDGSLSDSQTLAVTVANVNEAPTITSNGGGDSASITINENALTVSALTSTDPEGGARVYSISGGSDAAKFSINATTGSLAFAAAPNFEAPTDANGDNVYDVIVTASDGSLSDSQAISVTVANVIDGVTLTGTSKANTLTGGAAEDTINGLGGNDTLSGGGGADTINGGDGADKLTGGAGADRLTGGAGADTFTYTALSDSSFALADVLTDFSTAQGDKIGLSAIDANTGVAGDQAFSWIGTSAFSGVAGQLRYYQSGGDTFVTGDVNGDSIGDFLIQIDPLVTLSSNYFIL